MATLNPIAEAEALAQRLVADAQDPIEARRSLFFAAGALTQATVKATAVAEEHKAGLVLEQRAAKSGKTVQQMKDDLAEANGKHPSVVTALEVIDAISVDALATPVDPLKP